MRQKHRPVGKNDGTLAEMIVILLLIISFLFVFSLRGYQNDTVPENFYPKTGTYP